MDRKIREFTQQEIEAAKRFADELRWDETKAVDLQQLILEARAESDLHELRTGQPLKRYVSSSKIVLERYKGTWRIERIFGAEATEPGPVDGSAKWWSSNTTVGNRD